MRSPSFQPTTSVGEPPCWGPILPEDFPPGETTLLCRGLRCNALATSMVEFDNSNQKGRYRARSARCDRCRGKFQHRRADAVEMKDDRVPVQQL
jgi:hypothetical protein